MATILSNVLDAKGLSVATKPEIIAFLTAKFQEAYGNDVDLSSASPDGQLMNNIAQLYMDVLELTVDGYNSFNLDAAVGTQLDQRGAMIGVQRQNGTYSETPITLTVDRALTLYGLDQDAQPIYTVSDNAGNQWLLEATQIPSGAGSYQYTFRAGNPGRVSTIPNTITVPVTVVIGVTAINNPAIYSTLGIDEETDAAYRIRMQRSMQSRSQGFYDQVFGAISNVSGVTAVYLHENPTDSIDSDGVPAHSVWLIVAGNATDADIATALYGSRTLGCGMKGNKSYSITQSDGTPFTVYWDVVSQQLLYVFFNASSVDGVNAPKVKEILDGLASALVPGIAQSVNIGQLVTAVQSIDPNCLVTSEGLSSTDSGPFLDVLPTSDISKQFVIQSQNIYIVPVVLLPAGGTVAKGTNQQFTAYGGSQLPAISTPWTIPVNNSGGTISNTGLYSAGIVSGTDTIQYQDNDGNLASAQVIVQ